MLKKYKLYILTALYWMVASDGLFTTILLPLISSLDLPFHIFVYVSFYCMTSTYILFELFFSILISNKWSKIKTKQYFINIFFVFVVLQLYRHFWFMNYISFPLPDSIPIEPGVFLSSPLFQLLPFVLTLKTLKQYQNRVIFVILVSLVIKILYYFALENILSIQAQLEQYFRYFEFNALRAIYYIDILLLLGSVIKIKSENKL
ncbi:MAG: hypothetical protein ACK5C0_00670 [Candidatus Kapaibacterium sp.]|jgi:hypothetical protein